jgi:hypothetical protein
VANGILEKFRKGFLGRDGAGCGVAPPFTRFDYRGSGAQPVPGQQSADAAIGGSLPGDRTEADQLEPGLLVEGFGDSDSE